MPTTFPPGAILRAAKITSIARTAPQIHDHLPRSKIGEAHRVTTTSRKLDSEFRDQMPNLPECKDPVVRQTRRQVGLRSDKSKKFPPRQMFGRLCCTVP